MKVKKRIIATVIVIMSATGYYFYRWGNYANRPLFSNVFSAGRDGIGPWNWLPLPPPIFDSTGRMMLVDFQRNIIAIIDFRDARVRSFEISAATSDSFELFFGEKPVKIPAHPNCVFEVNDSGVVVENPIPPGTAARIHESLDIVKLGQKFEIVCKATFDKLLKPPDVSPAR